MAWRDQSHAVWRELQLGCRPKSTCLNTDRFEGEVNAVPDVLLRCHVTGGTTISFFRTEEARPSDASAEH